MSQTHKKPDHAPQTADQEPLKTVLKFDTGADGFQIMVYVLIIFAVLLLGLGIYFILSTFGHRSV